MVRSMRRIFIRKKKIFDSQEVATPVSFGVEEFAEFETPGVAIDFSKGIAKFFGGGWTEIIGYDDEGNVCLDINHFYEEGTRIYNIPLDDLSYLVVFNYDTGDYTILTRGFMGFRKVLFDMLIPSEVFEDVTDFE